MDIGQALTQTIIGRPEDAAADIARHFHPSYVQVTDGVVSDYSAFVEHIEHVRTVAQHGDVVVHEVLQADGRIADRHTATVIKRDGTRSAFEVLLIGELSDDGRLLRVVETTRQVSGDVADADLGRATAGS